MPGKSGMDRFSRKYSVPAPDLDRDLWKQILSHPNLRQEPMAHEKVRYRAEQFLEHAGSTGKPKVVQVEHRSVVNFLLSMKKKPRITERDVLASVTTVSFDIAALDLFLPLSVGARVVLASRATAADGRRLKQLIENSGATVM